MELRKDPITRSWVVVGHPEREKPRPDPCPLCPENRLETKVILDLPASRAPGRFAPIRISGRCITSKAIPSRTAEGIYDRMDATGAHEIIVETPDHAAIPRADAGRTDRARARSLRLAHRGPEARCPLQIRGRLQESRPTIGRGMVTFSFAGDCDHVCSAPHSLRAARRARMVSRHANAACFATSSARKCGRRNASSTP